MKHKKPSKTEMLSVCAEIYEDDGIDPKILLRKKSRTYKGKKTLQLCSQIAKSLNYSFAGECNDDILRNLYVVQVKALDVSRVLVIVNQHIPDETPLSIILGRLATMSGKLRAEVAIFIHRKKTPELLFCVTTSSKK